MFHARETDSRQLPRGPLCYRFESCPPVMGEVAQR